ncbi:hypothetical protein LSTR_LSTR013146 [Laodelphax striatellus]|uniref:Corticotropin-releasing factor domain-containing protein n=1 Tax=Laodelphax striatellus TaxID=195883 RepID=A0A482XK96_LAOST|nr:hypothetical protein LSTR_LSTR013146 [Laodelphax striatellus]
MATQHGGLQLMTSSLLLLLLMMTYHGSEALALGGAAERAAAGNHETAPLDEASLLLDEREAEVREQLLREYEAMQQQERNAAYLALLLDKLRSLPPLVPASAADYRPMAPPSPPQDLPVAAPLQQQYPLQLQQRSNPEEIKKSNYISYCHFKICNMGKRKWN